MADRVVFDCNVYFQALISSGGPAGQCLFAAGDDRLDLFLSEAILLELQKVCLREPLASRFRITEPQVEAYLAHIRSIGTVVENIPHVFQFERDPDDEHYVDLAIATRSRLLVSRDKDLLSLADVDTTEGAAFLRGYPNIEILTPVEMLARLPPK